jgi:hypothetical protein
MEFNEIKSAIRLYSRSSIVSHVLEKLNHIQRTKNFRFPAWKLLTLIKWAYLHTSDDNNKQKITWEKLEQIEKLIETFETEFDRLSFKEGATVKRSFRIMAYQQFSLQEGFINAYINRQIVLFRMLTSSFDIETKFKELTQMDLGSFINQCYFTYLYLHMSKANGSVMDDGILGEDFEAYYYKQFSASELRQFLHLLTAKKPADFDGVHKMTDERLQLFENDLFLIRPFLRFKGKYRLPFRPLYNLTMKHFLYTYLREVMPGFAEEFGNRLERYLELGMKETGMQYSGEGVLKKSYSLTKVADYWIKPNVLVECKATELKPRSGILRDPDTMARDLNSSIIKAYKQLLATANAINPKIEWWGIIVTYREMYLGFGVDAWEEFMSEEMEQFNKESKIELKLLPPENLFIIPIDDWDLIVQVVKDGKATLQEILAKARERNETDSIFERPFMINQVLDKYFSIEQYNLSYLNEAHKTIDVYSKAQLFS